MTRIIPGEAAQAPAPVQVLPDRGGIVTYSTPTRAKSSKISRIVKKNRPSLAPYEAVYKHIHANPCLSFVEDDTAALIVEKLSEYTAPAIEIIPRIGKTGVVGVLRNGPGPTILLRADMDGLPVTEKTGLPYASKKRMKDRDGVDQPVMHACGHDMHVTSLLAATHLLHSAHKDWSGTLLCCFQPAEEKGGGAQGMIDDGMYKPKHEGGHGVPLPDIVLGGHVQPNRAGTVTTRKDVMMAASDSLQITFHGKGGHASAPQHTIDPVIMAASTVMRLQTIVSREVAPLDAAVLTIGSLHAGFAENIISDTAVIKTNVRSYSPAIADSIRASIERIVKAEADASGAKEAPTIETIGHFPVTMNDAKTTGIVQDAFGTYFGDSYTDLEQPQVGSEDFATLGTAIKRPTCFWLYGGHDPKDWDKRVKEGTTGDVPSNHSPYFAPCINPTLETAVDALAVAALTWLVKKD